MSDANDVVVSAEPLEADVMAGDQIMAIVRKVEDVIITEPVGQAVAALLAIAIAAIRPDLVAEGIPECITYVSSQIAMFQLGTPELTPTGPGTVLSN